jgi:hypothetical protein
MDMSITVHVMQPLISKSLLSKSWSIPKSFRLVDEGLVNSQSHRMVRLLVRPQSPARSPVCSPETTMLQPCGRVVCRRIPKWRGVSYSLHRLLRCVYKYAVSLAVFLLVVHKLTRLQSPEINDTLATMQPTIFLTVLALLTATNAMAIPPYKRDAGGVGESQVRPPNTSIA